MYILLTLMAIVLQSDPLPKGYIEKSIRDESGDHGYLLFLPTNYTSKKDWPVVLFLHGAGDRGTDNRRQITDHLGRVVTGQRDKFPCIIIFPQAESQLISTFDIWYPTKPDGKRALAIVDSVVRDYSVDRDRLYLTGVSMGAFGTCAIACDDPSRWAAVVPISGGGPLDRAAKLRDVPFWAFHGDDDGIVSPTFSRKFVDKIKQAGGSPKYTEYPGHGHDAGVRAYSAPSLWTWLFQQKRGG